MGDWKVSLLKVITGQEEQVRIPKIPVVDIIDYLKDMGIEQTSAETNGYQCDFWVTFQERGNFFTLAGDVWYETHHTFTKGV